MAPHSGVAEAGFPKNPASLRRALNRLIEANYTVVGGAAGLSCCMRLAHACSGSHAAYGSLP